MLKESYLRPVRLAQWIERLPPKVKALGSTPKSDVSFCKLRE
jgi:hypothetical protein